jgi:hypothetical protein
MLSVHDFTLSCKREEDISLLKHKDWVLKVGCRSCCIKDTLNLFVPFALYIYYAEKCK